MKASCESRARQIQSPWRLERRSSNLSRRFCLFLAHRFVEHEFPLATFGSLGVSQAKFGGGDIISVIPKRSLSQSGARPAEHESTVRTSARKPCLEGMLQIESLGDG
jgi:hypothetical protein